MVEGKRLLASLTEIADEELRKKLGLSKETWKWIKMERDRKKWFAKMKARNMVQEKYILEAVIND